MGLVICALTALAQSTDPETDRYKQAPASHPDNSLASFPEVRTRPAPGGVVLAIPLESSPPEYTDEARLAGLEGTVWVKAVVGSDGTPRDPRVVHPLGLGLDESAVAAVRKWRFRPGMYEGREAETAITVPVDFMLPEKHSRWHLVRATFRPPDGASRPVFYGVHYPPGPGVTLALMEHARIVVAIGRQASATLSFYVDEQGHPVGFHVESVSDHRWGSEAIALVQNCEFIPGVKEGNPVSVPCTLTLVWGARNLNPEVFREVALRTNP